MSFPLFAYTSINKMHLAIKWTLYILSGGLIAEVSGACWGCTLKWFAPLKIQKKKIIKQLHWNRISLFLPSSSAVFHLGFPEGRIRGSLRSSGCENSRGPTLYLCPHCLEAVRTCAFILKWPHSQDTLYITLIPKEKNSIFCINIEIWLLK